MKNTQTVSQLQRCDCCNQYGFFSYTPRGADFVTCPCCGKEDFLNTMGDSKEPTPYDFLFEEEHKEDMRYAFSYCAHCRILFQLHCCHYAAGCSDDVSNAQLVRRWRHKPSGEVHEGMPLFDDTEDWFQHGNDVEVLDMHCPNGHATCKSVRSEENPVQSCQPVARDSSVSSAQPSTQPSSHPSTQPAPRREPPSLWGERLETICSEMGGGLSCICMCLFCCPCVSCYGPYLIMRVTQFGQPGTPPTWMN